MESLCSILARITTCRRQCHFVVSFSNGEAPSVLCADVLNFMVSCATTTFHADHPNSCNDWGPIQFLLRQSSVLPVALSWCFLARDFLFFQNDCWLKICELLPTKHHGFLFEGLLSLKAEVLSDRGDSYRHGCLKILLLLIWARYIPS